MNKLDILIDELCRDGVSIEKLGKIAKIETGKLNANAAIENGKYLFFTTAKEISKIDSFRWDAEALLIAGNANVGDVKHYKGKFEAYQRTYVLTNFTSNINIRYLYHVLKAGLKRYLDNKSNKAAMTYIVLSTIKEFPIPLPPLPVQEEIVRILDNFTELTAELTTELTAELTARKKQYEHYRDELLTFGDEVEYKKISEVCKSISAGGDLPETSIKGQELPSNEYPYPIYSNAIELDGLYGFTNGYKINSDAVTVSARGTIGFHVTREAKFTPIVRLITLIADKEKISTDYLNYSLYVAGIEGITTGIPSLTVPMIKNFKIPVPPLVEQERIVSILDKFDALVNDISIGLPAEIEARQKQYEYYREKLLTFKKSDVKEAEHVLL